MASSSKYKIGQRVGCEMYRVEGVTITFYKKVLSL